MKSGEAFLVASRPHSLRRFPNPGKLRRDGGRGIVFICKAKKSFDALEKMAKKNLRMCSTCGTRSVKNPMIMGKNLFTKAVSLLLCFALAGCATDQQRTKTQGTVIGAVGGAVLLGGLGALAGVLSGNRDNVARYAIAGAVAGAALGGVAGFKWGERVAFKKERYKTSEERLTANIQRASEVRSAAAKENNNLRGQIAQLHDRLAQLSAKSAAGNHDTQFRVTLVNFIDQQRQISARIIDSTGNEIADRTQALREDNDGNPQRVAELKAQIENLSAERAHMQQNNRELGAIRTRIGV